MTIYIDVVFFENLIIDSIILITNAIVLKQKIKWVRILLASILGSLYSIIAYASQLKVYSNIILKIILSTIIIYIAYNPQNVKQLCKYLLMFYLTSFVFGGATYALIYIVKPQEILMKNGLFLGTYPLKTIILASILAFILLITAFGIVKSKLTKKDMYCDIEVVVNGKKINTKAMIDTGNLLKEPITNTPVIILEHALLYECIPKEILNNLENVLGGDFEKIPEEIKQKYISKLKLIPFSSLGKQNGMLVGIKAEQVRIFMDESEKKCQNVIVGIYNKSLTKKGEYRALLGMEIL